MTIPRHDLGSFRRWIARWPGLAGLAAFFLLAAMPARGQECGNGICEDGEDQENCPADCGSPGPVCGDGVCAPDVEACGNCGGDCPSWEPGTTCSLDPYPGVCVSYCGNGLCGPGEDSSNCPGDCGPPPGPVCGDGVCTPDVEACGSCIGDCPCWQPGTTCSPDPYPGICVSYCGNGLCGPDESPGSCPQDCSGSGPICGDGICAPVLEDCGICAVDCPCPPGTACNAAGAPGQCVSACGNGVCDAGESATSCPQDCGGFGGCNHNGVCDPNENSAACPEDCRPPTCDSSDPSQVCCGDGTCGAGENPDSCSRDCPAVCGDGFCTASQGENNVSCPRDCCFSGATTCEAGCPAIPGFTISNPTPGVYEAVTFTAFPDDIAGTTVNWDFGDTEHCEGCRLTETHRYNRLGTFQVILTVTESVCYSTQLSFPQSVVVGPPSLRDDAQILTTSLPSCVTPDEAVEASVTVRNVGGTTWSQTFGQHLKLVQGADLFVPAAVPIEDAVNVTPGGPHTFKFNLGTFSQELGERTIAFQMANFLDSPFGEVVLHRLAVREFCDPTPPPSGDYTCHVSTRTDAGRPVPGVRTRLQAFTFEPEGDVLVAEDERFTDADGIADLAISREPSVLRVNTVTCFAENVNSTTPPVVTESDPVDVTPPRHLELDLTLVNDFAPRVFLPGLKEGRATARLYGNGAYDKVVVIPTPFRPEEQEQRWTEASLFEVFRAFLDAARSRGFDVWLMNTLTGQNIHEQAAEFAQLIDLAARRLGPDGKVIVAGYSLGGVNARLSTARYEADAPWRVELGVRPEMPVSLIAFGDAPLEGAHASWMLQEQLWQMRGDAFRKLNLNSCGAQQLLQYSFPTFRDNFDRFWSTGEDLAFPRGGPSLGVCDRFDGSTCVCDAGPAVRSVGGDGWADGPPIVAFSDGHPGPQACYGGDRDRDGAGKDVCEDLTKFYPPPPYNPRVADSMFLLARPLAPDIFIPAVGDDLVPGSRLGNVKRTECPFGVICGGVKEQFFAPTFIPFDSALPPGAPFAATWHADFNAVHGRGVLENIDRLLNEMEHASASAPAASAAAAPVQPADPSSGLSPVTVVFPNILADGTTMLTIAEQGPAPFPLYVHGEPQRYYNLESTVVTDASVNNPIEVCIDYSGIQFRDEDAIALFHHEAVGWVDITSYRSPAQKKVCGNTTSLSPFAIFEPANQAPVIPALAPIVLEATGPLGAIASLTAAGTYDPDRDALTFEWVDESGARLAGGGVAQVLLPIGEHHVFLRVRDRRGAEAVRRVDTTVRDTTAPAVELTVAGARVRTLSAQATDAVGVVLVRFVVDGAPIGRELTAPPYTESLDTIRLADGPHVVRAIATDAAGNAGYSAEVTIVVDNTPPTLALSASPSVLWPPNQKLVTVTVDVSLTDAIDPAPVVRLESVSCDDGCRPGSDIAGASLGTDDRAIVLRATRHGAGRGRTYTIRYSATDASGNVGRAQTTVFVPHDVGRQ